MFDLDFAACQPKFCGEDDPWGAVTFSNATGMYLFEVNWNVTNCGDAFGVFGACLLSALTTE